MYESLMNLYSLGHGLCAPFLQCLGQLSLLPPWDGKCVSASGLSNNNKWRWWL